MKKQSPSLFRPQPLQGSHLKGAAEYIFTLPLVKEISVYCGNSDSSIVFVAVVDDEFIDAFLHDVKEVYLDIELRHLRDEQVRLVAFDNTFPEFKAWRKEFWPAKGDMGVDILLLPVHWITNAASLSIEYCSERVNYIEDLSNGHPLYCFSK